MTTEQKKWYEIKMETEIIIMFNDETCGNICEIIRLG